MESSLSYFVAKHKFGGQRNTQFETTFKYNSLPGKKMFGSCRIFEFILLFGQKVSYSENLPLFRGLPDHDFRNQR